MCLGIPGKLLAVIPTDGPPLGKVDFGGVVKDVCLAYTPEAVPGQYVLVHVGFSLSVIDEHEAHETLALLEEIEAAADRPAVDDASGDLGIPPAGAPES